MTDNVCDAHWAGYIEMQRLMRETSDGLPSWFAAIIIVTLLVVVPLGVVALLAMLRVLVTVAWSIIGS